MVLASYDLSYCFDIKIEAERKIAKKIVSGKWYPIVYTDDLVTGWKVSKNWPSWTFDADAWKTIVIDGPEGRSLYCSTSTAGRLRDGSSGQI